MKRYNFLQWIFIFSSLFTFMVSCKDDLSTLDLNKLPEVSVDTTGQSSLSVFQFDKLALDPKVIITNDNGHEFTYEWFINLLPTSLEYIPIGNTKKLEYDVTLVPTNTGKPHQILLKITDKNTGIEYFQDWPLTIRNGIGEGLVIVETYDGQNTDLSHIMSPMVTPDYSDEKVTKKIYSGVNNSTIPGLVNNLRFSKFVSDNILLGSTANSLFAIKTLDYTLFKQNVDLYYTEQTSYGASFISSVTGPDFDVFIKDGKLYSSWLATSRIGLPWSNNYVIPSIIGLNAKNDRGSLGHNIINFYSEQLGQFIYQQAFQFGDLVMKPVPSMNSTLFNPNNVPNHKPISAAVNNQGDFIHVLQHKQTGNYGLYIMDGFNNPKYYANLANAPEISQAIKFVPLLDQNVLMYATKTKIYAVVYSTTTPTFALRYTAAAGEEITTLNQFFQADYPKRDVTWSEPHISTNGKQLILGTYNGTEGKVHILPLINEGIANIDQANIKTYTGFGKILFTTTQL